MPTETLRQKQSRFAMMLPRLIDKAYRLGYEVTLGDAYRTKLQAMMNAVTGKGVVNSLHCDRLAIDLNLFKDGKYITTDEGHRDLGAFWKSLSPDHRWGGDFKSKDFNHYSLSPDGKRG